MFKRLAALLAFCFPLLVVAHALSAPVVSYTVTGSPGNWTLDFSVTNTLGGANGIYFLAVELPDHNSPAWPAGWYWWSNPASTWSNFGLGGSSTVYNNIWVAWAANGAGATSIPNGQTLSGFEAVVTTTDAPTSVPWSVFATYFEQPYYTGNDCFSGNLSYPGEVGFDNPGFEGIAQSGASVPESSTLLLLSSGLAGIVAWRMRRSA